MDQKNPVYRVIFNQKDKSYELYARYLSDDNLMGFIQIEELIFSPRTGSLVVDPGEEQLRNEFKGVNRCYIPMHLVTRIDEVVKEGAARVMELDDSNHGKKSNVRRIYDDLYKREED